MNAFFERLVSKLLSDFADGYSLRDQHRLHKMYAYTPGFNPRCRWDPTPRPDFALMKNGRVVKLLDAKYRDLWENNLPSHMLYQLTIYAVSDVGDRTATILYPSTDRTAKIQKIDIKRPTNGSKMGIVMLQPVDLVKISDLLDADRSAKSPLSSYINSLIC